MNNKTLAFDYFVYQLLNWYKEAYGENIVENDLSILKVLKLLFFMTAIGAKKEDDDSLLDNTFDKFYAMPYGHVEGDIYDSIKQKNTKSFIDNYKTVLDDIDFSSLGEKTKEEIVNRQQKVDIRK